MAEDDDEPREPNDDAYLKEEMRVGPPLEYVAEKFRHSLEAIHHLLADLRKTVGGDSPLFSAPGRRGQSARMESENGRKRQVGQFAVQIVEILAAANKKKV